ncbi:MAG: ABC transporter substrate-binding protein [Acidimicrobiales bacterium]|jgi:peptide/nickel transport system substrate-binding protein
MYRRALIGITLASALMLGASACSSSSSSSSTTTTTTPSSGKTVVLTEESNTGVTFTQNFNPFDSNSLSTEMNMRTLAYEPLLEFDFLQPTTIHDWLATGYSWSNAGETLTFTLRHGVTWSDGKPFTSADVAFTFNLINDNAAANYSGVPPLAGPVTTSGAYTVVMTFKAPAYSDLAAIGGATFIVPEHIWSSISSPATATVATPIGTGPYTLKSFSTTLVTFVANPHYWGGTPPVSQVDIPSYSSNSSAATALAAGQLDWAGNDIANVQKVFVNKDPSHNFTFFAPGNTVALYFNVAKGGALADPKVRQAISFGIDRAQLGTEGESGYELPATSTSGLILPNQSQYLSTSDTANLPTTGDASKVASILASDGYAKVGSYWEKNGLPITFSIEDPTSYSDYYADAQLISNQLNADGIKASVDGVAATTWYTDLADGNFQTAIHWGSGGATPFVQYQNWLDYTLSAPIGKSAAADYGRYSSPQAAAALKALETTNPSDQAAVSSAVSTLSSLMSSEVPVAPLLYGADWDEYSTTQFTGWPTASNPYMDPSPNDPELPYILMHLKVTS